MDNQLDDDADLVTRGSSSSQGRPVAHPDLPIEGVEASLMHPSLNLSGLLKRQNSGQSPKLYAVAASLSGAPSQLITTLYSPRAKLQISTSPASIPDDDEGYALIVLLFVSTEMLDLLHRVDTHLRPRLTELPVPVLDSRTRKSTRSVSDTSIPLTYQWPEYRPRVYMAAHWADHTTNHYHIQSIGNANFGNTYGALNQTMTFTETLLERLPNFEETTDPAKLVLEIARTVIEIKQAVHGNMDVIEMRIASTAAQLFLVEKALTRWPDGSNGEKDSAMEEFNCTLSCELRRLCWLQEGANARKGADCDHDNTERDQIAQIFESINGARMRFELDTSIRLREMVDAISQTLKRSLRKDLEASDAADYKYVGEDQEILYRVACTRGTRVHILDMITGWANGHGRQCVFWLFGPAGSGKSTIAYTIARRFELTSDADDTIVLGGNFFCSRQVKEARHESQIIRTVAYHLALKCKPFADALDRSGQFEMIHRSVLDQIKGLLVGPWEESRSVRKEITPSHRDYLIVIDAVDELVNGGSNFLRNLLAALNEYDLPGLKFFVTSRSDPKLVEYVESFKRKELYHLQDVEKVQAQADIRLYLEESFPHFKGCSELDTLLTFADGLFICAATLVRHVEPRSDRFTEAEQRKVIQRLSDGRATTSLNLLYDTILSEAFKYEGDILETRLDILYTFLCTAEPTTTAVVDGLLSVGSIPAAVLSSLHAVLYTDGQHRVLSYHKSFSDFMFDRLRCPTKVWRDPVMHHRRLTEACFHVMNAKPSGLRFNIANIPTSFIFDSDNKSLRGEIQENISTVLSYSCRNWSHHLAQVSEMADDPLHSALTEFLQLRVLFWIESMNLLGCRGHCQQMLQATRRWLTKCHPALGSKFSGVASFALYFSGSPAALSTPHLYLSALATWGRDYEPFNRWREHFGRIPHFTTNSTGGARPLMSIKIDSEVYAIAVACNGTRIITGSREGSVQVWNLMTSEQGRVFNGHSGKVLSVASSSDGTRIVSGSDDCSMRVWNAETGVEEWLWVHDGTVWSVAISSDGSQVASVSRKSVFIWGAGTGQSPMILHGHAGRILSVSFSGDGAKLVSGSDDATIRVWDIVTGKVHRVLEGHCSGVLCVAFSIDGTRIISGSHNAEVRLWDPETGETQQGLKCPSSVNSVVFSSDGTQVVVGLGDGSVQMWSPLTGEKLAVIAGHRDAVTSVVFLDDGAQVVSGSEDGVVRVWDPGTEGQGSGQFQGHTEGVHSVVSPTDPRREASGSADRSVRPWGSLTGQEQGLRGGHTSWVWSVAFSPNGTCIVSGSGDNTVRLWDVMTPGQEQRTLALMGHEDSVLSVAFSPDGSRVVSGSSDRTIRLWDVVTGQEQMILREQEDSVLSVSFSPDGSHIVSGSDDGTVRLWDAETGYEERVLGGHEGPVSSVTFSPDGAYIISGSDDKTIRLWDMATGQEQRTLRGHEGYVRSVAFLANGTCIISGSVDKTVRVWDVATGQEQKTLRGHEGAVYSVASSTDGRRIVSGSIDKTIRLWDVETGQEQGLLKGHGGPVVSVALSSDDRRIVSGSFDNSIQVWDPAFSNYASDIIQGQSDSEKIVTGWLLSSSNPQERLMHVPPDAYLPRPPCILTITHKHPCSFVDLSFAAVGDQWQNCYTPVPS